MSQTTFKEWWENFLSYVKLFAFLILVGGVGYYFYTHQKQEAPAPAAISEDAAPGTVNIPAQITTEKPSQLVGAVMAANLPILLNDFSEKNVEFLPNFIALEKAVDGEKSKPTELQPAWNIASQWCQQMRATLKERNAAAKLLPNVSPSDGNGAQAAKPNPYDAERLSREAFFTQAAKQRWTATVLQRKKKIDAIYHQLLAAEAQAGK